MELFFISATKRMMNTVQLGCTQRSSLFAQGYTCDPYFNMILDIFEFILCNLKFSSGGVKRLATFRHVLLAARQLYHIWCISMSPTHWGRGRGARMDGQERFAGAF